MKPTLTLVGILNQADLRNYQQVCRQIDALGLATEVSLTEANEALREHEDVIVRIYHDYQVDAGREISISRITGEIWYED